MAARATASLAELETSIDPLCDWLDAKLEETAARSIEDLSLEGGTDLKILVTRLETRELPASAIQKTVELLTKEGIQTSVGYDKTAKLSARLLGSPCMLQLQSHNSSLCMCDLELRELRNYGRLMEVIWDRRAAYGWKDASLDAVQRKCAEIDVKTEQDAIALRRNPDYKALQSGSKRDRL